MCNSDLIGISEAIHKFCSEVEGNDGHGHTYAHRLLDEPTGFFSFFKFIFC